MPPILDPCCGSRMMWFDKQDQRCLFGDARAETHLLKDRQYLRHLEIRPDVQLDFTALPFPDGQFKLVAMQGLRELDGLEEVDGEQSIIKIII